MQCSEIGFTKTAEQAFAVGNIADMHFTFISQWNSNNVTSIQLFVNDTTAHRITIQSNQKIEQGCPVTYTYIFLRSEGEKISSEK